jgi:hypothetical protein
MYRFLFYLSPLLSASTEVKAAVEILYLLKIFSILPLKVYHSHDKKTSWQAARLCQSLSV